MERYFLNRSGHLVASSEPDRDTCHNRRKDFLTPAWQTVGRKEGFNDLPPKRRMPLSEETRKVAPLFWNGYGEELAGDMF
ncbi:MAG: hypothetical protein D6820_12590 [Lentisphaerae bacterium]|nr:MAG: hypothetical protein D6820_12590 [Lentisphaerota bacterium]